MKSMNPALRAKVFEKAAADPFASAMSYAGTGIATLTLFLLFVLSGVVGWMAVGKAIAGEAAFPWWILVGVLVALVLAIVTGIKPKFARITGPIYAIVEGAVVGALSGFYNAMWDGIVLQAVAGTACVFAVVLFLYSAKILKPTRKFAMVLTSAMVGIMLMYGITFLLSLFGVNALFWAQPTWLGIGISALICVVAGLSLVLDFGTIQQGVEAGAPKYMEWYAAFGLMVTLVWLYLEVLRLLALLRSR